MSKDIIDDIYEKESLIEHLQSLIVKNNRALCMLDAEIDRLKKNQAKKTVKVWEKHHIDGIVWVMITDQKLERGARYKVRDNNFPTPYLKVKYEGMRIMYERSSSLQYYIVVELNNYHPEQ